MSFRERLQRFHITADEGFFLGAGPALELGFATAGLTERIEYLRVK